MRGFLVVSTDLKEYFQAVYLEGANTPANGRKVEIVDGELIVSPFKWPFEVEETIVASRYLTKMEPLQLPKSIHEDLDPDIRQRVREILITVTV